MTLLGTGETVTIKRANPGVGRYGSTELDWNATTDSDVSGALFAPQTSTEDRDGRDAVIADATVYLPDGTDIAANDRIMIRGATYEVSGLPSSWRDPFGSDLSGLEVRLRLVVG